jgi:hypothetical protein
MDNRHLDDIKYRHENYNRFDLSCSWDCAEAGGQANRDCGKLLKMVDDLNKRLKDAENSNK